MGDLCAAGAHRSGDGVRPGIDDLRCTGQRGNWDAEHISEAAGKREEWLRSQD